jgi:hypothetical protein
LCPDVFWPPSLGESLDTRHNLWTVHPLAQAISRNAYLVITCVALYLGGLVTSIVGVRPSGFILLALSSATKIIATLIDPLGDSATGWGIFNHLRTSSSGFSLRFITCSWSTPWSCAVRRPAFDRKHNTLFTCTCSFLRFCAL